MPPTHANPKTPAPPASLAARHQARISEILAGTSANPSLRIQLLRIEVDECTHDRISLSLDIMIEHHEFSACMDHRGCDYYYQIKNNNSWPTAAAVAPPLPLVPSSLQPARNMLALPPLPPPYAPPYALPPYAPPNIAEVFQEEKEMKRRVHEVLTRKMLKEHDDVGTARDLAEGYIAAAKERVSGVQEIGGGMN